jgi:hypothetical protein
MPWETEGELVRFSGNLSELMNHVMAAYEQDSSAGTAEVSSGVYVTATAIVLREILLEALAEEAEAAEFIERMGAALEEEDDGTVTVQTLAILEDVAEHIEPTAWQQWLADEAAREAILEVAGSTLSG